MRRAVEVELTKEERKDLERIVRAPTSALRAVRRARVVLLAADGWTNDRIAEQLGMGVNTVGRWRRRFVAEGVDVLGRMKKARHTDFFGAEHIPVFPRFDRHPIRRVCGGRVQCPDRAFGKHNTTMK